MSDELLTAADIAAEAGVHRSTVGDWVARGELPVAQERKNGRGASRLFRRSEAQPLIERTRTKRAASSEVPSQPASVN